MVEMNAEYTLLDGIREEFKDAEQPIRMSQEDLLDFFNSLKTNEEILVWYNSGIRSADDWTEMTVGRRSESKKYGVKKVALKGTGGGKFYLYNRKGRISLAMGDMATVLIAAKKREVRNAETFESDQFPSMHYGDHDSDAQEKYQEFLDEWDGDDGPPSFEEWEKQLDEYDRKLQEYQDSAEYAEESFITTDMSPSYIDVVVTDDAGSSFEGRLYGTMKENHSGAKKGLVSYDPSTGNVVYYHKGKEFVGDVENSDMNYNAETFDADGRDMTLEEIEETYGEGRLCDHCFDGTFERGTHDDGSTYYRCWKCKQFEAESFGVEFNEWADQELMSHGKDISFKDWAEDEGMKHGDVPITDWAQHEEESHDERYEAETDPLWLEKVKHQHYKDMIANLESRNDLTEMDRVRLHHYKDMVKINADEYGAEDNTESIKSAIRKLEKALGKMDGATYKMHDLDISAQPTTIAGFEMSRNGEKYDGGSYLIMTDGSIVNAAMGNADYGNITENFSAECEECGVSIENGKQVSGHYGENFCPPCARAIAEANPQFEVKETTQKDDFGAESIVKKYGMIAAGVITAFALLPEIKKRF